MLGGLVTDEVTGRFPAGRSLAVASESSLVGPGHALRERQPRCGETEDCVIVAVGLEARQCQCGDLRAERSGCAGRGVPRRRLAAVPPVFGAAGLERAGGGRSCGDQP